MKKVFSIVTIRQVATITITVIIGGFIGFSTYLWFTYSNVLSDRVEISASKALLTNFDTSKFDRAVERLQKRRGLEDPAAGIRDPFGDISE